MYPERNKIPAFTIVEAVVSMAVTAIILTIVFIIFSVTSQRLDDFKKQNEGISDLNRMSYSLNKAVFESSSMQMPSGDRLVFSDYKENDVTYFIMKEYFVRAQGDFTDTFHLQTKRVFIEELQSENKPFRYQRLHWELIVDQQKTDMFFYKKVYLEELLKPYQKNEF
ncbi:hypothetical protein Q763_08355 [Flavobacterium beibuense F44-8]|uniref:Prepilin-type N-terminal cleavage/methylation domain-containing protein n=1 Tax=Flavobacterium beibuense F44-8 TaxID=1406840 RepID=A0A0A2LMV7_9FLAO|nr:hypothetical protein [Flavobacterium beibuense]KGO81642.1 hypothetical protein Q763_08355 [Flavobacterium beibuense F44-8]